MKSSGGSSVLPPRCPVSSGATLGFSPLVPCQTDTETNDDPDELRAQHAVRYGTVVCPERQAERHEGHSEHDATGETRLEVQLQADRSDQKDQAGEEVENLGRHDELSLSLRHSSAAKSRAAEAPCFRHDAQCRRARRFCEG